MNQNRYQQLLAGNNEDYENLIPVISTDYCHCLAAHNPGEQTCLYATGNPQAIYQQTPQQIYNSTSALDTGQTFSPQANVEQFLPSAQPPQVYPERTSNPLLTAYDSNPTVERQSTSTSITSFTTFSDDEHDHILTSASPRDDAVERRKDRRRAQNRAAQRAFRTRKEETIKESAVSLEALQNELTRVQNANAGLSETASNLSAQILPLHPYQDQRSGERDRATFGTFTVKNTFVVHVPLDHGVDDCLSFSEDSPTSAMKETSRGLWTQMNLGTD